MAMQSARTPSATVAVAGIVATALVGIVGSATTWIVARDNRVTQITLAQDERIYDKRSSAYIDVLMAMQSLSDDLRLLRFENVPTWPDFQRKQANLRARMTAFASTDALRLYNEMFFSASRTLAAVESFRQSSDYSDPVARSTLWRRNEDRQEFDKARREFQFVSAEEIGGTRARPSLPSASPSAEVTGLQFISQPSYPGNCGQRDPGTVCIKFNDGYVWLVTDAIRSWQEGGAFQGQPIQIAIGERADYQHVLHTDLVREIRK